MLDYFVIVSQQVLILFILIAVGFICGKIKLIDDYVAKKLTDIILMIAMPCVIVNAFQREYNPEMLVNLLITAVCAVAIHIVTIVIASLVFRDKDEGRKKVLRFGTIFSNCAFMSIPLQEAVLGSEGVFYCAIFIGVFNLFSWTYGLVLMSGDKKQMSVKKLVTNPGILGVVIGVILFICSITLPAIIGEPIRYLGTLNTPVPMLIIGFYLSQVNFVDVFAEKKNYVASIIRLLLIPIIALGVMYLCGIRGTMLVSIVISASAPVAASCTMFATKYGGDTMLSVRLVALSTVISVVTMPLVVDLANSLSV